MRGKIAVLTKTLKRLLMSVLAILSIYLAVAPIIPDVEYRVEEIFRNDSEQNSVDSGESQVDESNNSNQMENERIDSGDTTGGINKIVIPRIKVEVDIVEGYTEDALSKGVWHLPNSAVPGSVGNVVITGHRFQYTVPTQKSFYNLDKLLKEDRIIVFWEGKEYVYIVADIYETDPEDMAVEADKGDVRLTLYTCTPIWTSSKRLVVVAFPEQEEAQI